MKPSDKTELGQELIKGLKEAVASQDLTIPNKPIDADRFSKTAVKRLLQLNKQQLVQMISNLSNYAEAQKAANILLSNAMQELRQQRAKELESLSVLPESNEQIEIPEESK